MAREEAQTDTPNEQLAFEDGDENAFREAVEPLMPGLVDAAAKALGFYVAQGHLHQDDLAPEEVVGEALIYAWEHRPQRPKQMSLRNWLLATQYRVLRGLVEQTKAYRRDKAISLDAPVPTDDADGRRPGDDVQEWFYDWYQPDTVVTWEDVTPGRRPVDYEVPLNEAAQHLLDTSPETYHVLLMHDEFEMSLPEVAFTMGRGVEEVAESIEQAHATLRQRLGLSSEIEETDHPATE